MPIVATTVRERRAAPHRRAPKRRTTHHHPAPQQDPEQRRSTRTGTIVLADSFYWEAFARFGAALIKRGIPVVRYTGSSKDTADRSRFGLHKLLFPEMGWLPESSGHGAAARVLVDKAGEPSTVVVEASDDLADAMLSTGASAAMKRCSGAVDEHVLYDKFEMTELVRSHGVHVPKTWEDLSVIGDQDEVVVKHRLGFGGHGVRIVPATVDAIRRAQIDMSPQPEAIFLQEVITGETVHVGGVARDGVIYACAAYRSRSGRHGVGPATSIEIIDDSHLLAVGARIVAGLGYTGSFGMDFARGAGGEPHFLDFNSRIFGSWIGLQRAGLDFIGAYLTVYGLSDQFDPRPARVGTVCSVQPTAAVVSAGSPFIRTFACSVRQAFAEREFLGTRWLAVALTESCCAAAIRVVRMAFRAKPVSSKKAGGETLSPMQ